jgi:hypothetical protein
VGRFPQISQEMAGGSNNNMTGATELPEVLVAVMGCFVW